MKNIPAISDGDTSPVLRFRLMDGGTAIDAASMAVELKIKDATTGTTICTRPGVPVSPKTDGYVDVWMKGMETDWDGAGRTLLIVPKFYMALDANGAAATNLLANSSFDTGAGSVADSWTLGAAQGDMAYSLNQDDPAPPVIFGKCQRSYAAIGSTSLTFISQSPAGAVAAGDYFSCGVWYRASVATGGSVVGSEHYMTLLGGANVLKTNFPASNTDWTFIRAEKHATDAAGTSSFSLVNFDAKGYEIRYDDAFLFKGRWRVAHGNPLRLEVKPHVRPSKTNFTTANFIRGVGGFEYDSNADGIADGWSRTGTGNTYALEVDPDHLSTTVVGAGASKGAEKVTLSASATERLRLIYRGNFLAGQTWRFQVAYKNSGALSGSPANGDFGIVLHTEEFDGAYEESSLAGANFSLSSIAAYVNKFRTLTLTANRSVLVCDINLKTATGGTLWLDDASLFRSA